MVNKPLETPRGAGRDTSQTSAANDGNPPHPTDVDRLSYSSRHKSPEMQPKESIKRRYGTKKASIRLSKALSGLGEGLLDCIAPAHDGSAFVENERQKCAIAEMIANDPGPWHEYERLDSDAEVDDHNLFCPQKKTRLTKFKEWITRITTLYGESIAPQGIGAIGTL
ncbi:hypothetical protein F4861DRAFT_538104 [Xylaria intraflava]|nr:hypothetical protein F4861DRAFT_538104 [Xylaria intraflava]